MYGLLLSSQDLIIYWELSLSKLDFFKFFFFKRRTLERISNGRQVINLLLFVMLLVLCCSSSKELVTYFPFSSCLMDMEVMGCNLFRQIDELFICFSVLYPYSWWWFCSTVAFSMVWKSELASHVLSLLCAGGMILPTCPTTNRFSH